MPKGADSTGSVFVSYAMRDKPRVQAMIDQLKERGVIAEGEDYVEASDLVSSGSAFRGIVKEAIQAASNVVVLWSGAGAESPSVNYEAGMARALGKPTVVVVAKESGPAVPAQLADTQVIELLQREF